EHLPEFQADVPPAEDEQVLGQLADLHQAGVVQIGNGVEAFQPRYDRPRAGVDEDPLALQDAIADADAPGPQEAGLAAVKVQVRSAVLLALLAGAELGDDPIFAVDDLAQVHADFAGPHTPAAGVAGVVGHLGAGDHRLGRGTAGVDAGA